MVVDATTAYIGLGSNLDDPLRQLQQACQQLAACDSITILATSSFYCSPPMGPQDQPDYLNAVMAIRTVLPPLALLHQLHIIENHHQRVRLQRWGARTLDLDLLLYGQEIVNTPELTVPHMGLAERAFVLYPLYEIAPNLDIPGKGAIQALLRHCPLAGLQRLTV
jgi:2-amino-4-hydroxy-6-hydroxymethyldihydropteridine diphosphokinase